MIAEEIFSEVQKLSNNKPLTISLSGGNPATQDFSALIKLGQKYGYRFAVETQGSVAQDWFADLDVLTLSPNPPSSDMKTDWSKLEDCINAAKGKPETALKIVVFDDGDYEYARIVSNKYPELPMYLQPGNHQVEGESDVAGLNERMRWLVDKALEDQWFNANILPQLHVMIWGNERGV